MYREYRDLTVAQAVTACYRDMGARHRSVCLHLLNQSHANQSPTLAPVSHAELAPTRSK